MIVPRFRTWQLEQAVLLVLVFAAAWVQLRALPWPSTPILDAPAWTRWVACARLAWPIIVSATITVVAQKVRSIADRQTEANRRAGVHPVVIECTVAQGRWGLVLQALGLFASVSLAPTAWSIPVALYVGFYSLWRTVYRRMGERRVRVYGTCVGCGKPVTSKDGGIVFLHGDELVHHGHEPIGPRT